MELKNQPGMVKVEIAFIGETIQPDAAKTFVKREIAFNVYEEINGNEYTRLYCMQATGSTDKPQYNKTKLLDKFKVGDCVNVTYSIAGTTIVNDKLIPTQNNPSCLTGFNNLSISRIEIFNPQQLSNSIGGNYPAPQHQPAYNPQPNVQNNTSTSFQQPQVDAPLDSKGQSKVWNTKTGTWDELPF